MLTEGSKCSCKLGLLHPHTLISRSNLSPATFTQLFPLSFWPSPPPGQSCGLFLSLQGIPGKYSTVLRPERTWSKPGVCFGKELIGKAGRSFQAINTSCFPGTVLSLAGREFWDRTMSLQTIETGTWGQGMKNDLKETVGI